jgi:phospholipase/carboxylesterase
VSTTAIEIGPDIGAASAVAILAHGRGGEPEDMADVVRRLGCPRVRFILPRAANRTWYPAGFMAPAAQNEPFLSQALAQYEATVQGALAAGVPLSRLVVGGFSQGACLTGGLLWKRPAGYGGAIMFTGGLIGPPGTNWPSQPSLKDVPVLLTCGDRDDWVPLSRVEETATALTASGARVFKHIYPGRPHLIAEDEIFRARALLDAVAAR